MRGVEQLHLTLADDASVDAVLEPIADAIAPATWIVDHTTTAPTPTAERVARWDARGKRYVHAPVFMGPQNAREATGAMLVSGEKTRFEALGPTLETMTGRVVYLGEEPGRAAAFKLFGNLVIISTVGVLGDVNRLARALGISTADAMGLFQAFNPGQLLPARAAKLAEGDFTPSFEATMARKDLRLMLEEAHATAPSSTSSPGSRPCSTRPSRAATGPATWSLWRRPEPSAPGPGPEERRHEHEGPEPSAREVVVGQQLPPALPGGAPEAELEGEGEGEPGRADDEKLPRRTQARPADVRPGERQDESDARERGDAPRTHAACARTRRVRSPGHRLPGQRSRLRHRVGIT